MNKKQIACEKSKLWYKENKDRKQAYDRIYNATNRDKKNEQSRAWAKANPALRSEIRKRDYYKNKGRCFANCAARRARVLKALPKWLSLDQKRQLREIYENRPEGYHVDHIIPLKGDNVSGLHVPWNLQYLPALKNFSKGNKYG